jgi:hypothetical protein
VYEKFLFLCNSVGAELMRRGDAAGALEALQTGLHHAHGLTVPHESDRSHTPPPPRNTHNTQLVRQKRAYTRPARPCRCCVQEKHARCPCMRRSYRL